MKKLRIVFATVCALALVSAFALAGCSSSSSSSSSASSASSAAKSDVTLQIFAANSLEKALPEVQALYTQKTGVQFGDTQFKASGDLVSQLAADSTAADVLITASTATMDTASKNGSIADDTRADMFKNDLVLCAAKGSSLKITDLAELGTNADITSFALGEPNTVPAGKYAVQSLKAAGLCDYPDGDTIEVTWDASVADKVNAGADKVGTVAKYVSSGEAQLGFVYSSDIYRYDGIEAIYTVPADMHKAIKYPGAVAKDSKYADEAAKFLEFCTTDPEAVKIFQQYGFELAA